MAKEEVKKFKTPEFRVSFPKVFKAEAFKEGDTPKFSITMLFDAKAQASDAFKILKGESKKAFIEKHGAAAWEGPKDWFGWPVGYHNPFKKPDADMVEKYDGYDADTIYTRASTQYAIPVVDEHVQKIIEETKFYAGCYAWAYVQINAYKNGANKGVSFYLQAVQKIRDGEAFSSRARAEDLFESVAPASEEASASGDDYDF